ncbi:Sperm flagellar protein 1 [Tritrichomonas musculus]|uniref:Sperm flagellar protein 1 n=1 Tax=Tritrichomonas musculus TaxID=1915356 RepID=A0ABR2GUV7_9EUKA
MEPLTDEQLEELYQWIDKIPLSRRKRNLSRDFADGVLMAEVVSHFFPRLVDLHNYGQALRVDTKIYNWKTLNSKVLKKFNFNLDTETITELANAKPGVIEDVLWDFRQVVNAKMQQNNKPYFDDELDDPMSNFAKMEAVQNETDRKMLLEKIQECEEQAEYIKALEAKIAKLEELMRLKDAKIAKLTKAKRPNH